MVYIAEGQNDKTKGKQWPGNHRRSMRHSMEANSRSGEKAMSGQIASWCCPRMISKPPSIRRLCKWLFPFQPYAALMLSAECIIACSFV
jgi:hypothetical protein